MYSADGSRILTWSEDGTARLWRLPQVTDKPAEYYSLEFQIRSGTRLDNAGEVRALTFEQWTAKKREFQEKFAE